MAMDFVKIGAVLATLCVGASGQAATVNLPITIRSFTGGPSVCIQTTASGTTALPDRLSFGKCIQTLDRHSTQASDSGYTDFVNESSGDGCCEVESNGGCPYVTDPYNAALGHINHPDFEAANNNGAILNLVLSKLGPDRKPVFNPDAANNPKTVGYALQNFIRSSNYDFTDWFRDSHRNKRVNNQVITLNHQSAGTYQYSSTAFFPLDAFLSQAANTATSPIWALAPYESGTGHKFSFCTEHHSYFLYTGAEVFSFTGDDDTWVFINDNLAVDLGADHSPVSGSVTLSANEALLGITKGNIYTFDYFECERHTTGSDVKITTSITPFCSVTSNGANKIAPVTAAAGSSFLDLVNSNLLIVSGSSAPIAATTITFGNAAGKILINQGIQLAAGFILDFTVQFSGAPAFNLDGSNTGHGSFSVVLQSSATAPTGSVTMTFSSAGTIKLSLSSQSQPDSVTNMVPWLQNLFDGATHSISVVYLSKPNWFQIFADDPAAMLTMKGVDLAQEVGNGGSGYIAITFNNNAFNPVWTSGEFSALSLLLTNIDASATVMFPGVTPVTSAAAGDVYSVKVQGYDKCANLMKSGGYPDQFSGVLTDPTGVVPTQTTTAILDNGDGSYTYTWKLTNTGTFTPTLSYVNAGGVLTALPNVGAIAPVTVLLGPVDQATVVAVPIGTNSTALNTPHSMTVSFKDKSGNVPTTANNPGYFSVSMVDATGDAASIAYTFDNVNHLYVLTYSASVAGIYTITATGKGAQLISSKFNNIVLGAPANTITGGNDVKNTLNTAVLIPVAVVLALLIPVVAYGAWRLHRYRQKWLERKNKHLELNTYNKGNGETATRNPIVGRQNAGSRFDLVNAEKKYREKIDEIAELKAKKQDTDAMLKRLTAELNGLQRSE